jgi:hypothetical protein
MTLFVLRRPRPTLQKPTCSSSPLWKTITKKALYYLLFYPLITIPEKVSMEVLRKVVSLKFPVIMFYHYEVSFLLLIPVLFLYYQLSSQKVKRPPSSNVKSPM